MRRHGGALALALLAGCGSEMVGEDAGSDSGAAMLDASTDGGGDAGPRDAGVPDSVEMAAMMTATEAADVATMLGAVPMADLEQGAFVDLDACLGAIDRIIGEDGLQTLALGDGANRTLADLQFVGRVIEVVTAVLDALFTAVQPEVMAVYDETLQLGIALDAYRDELVGLYRTRLGADPLFTPISVQHRQTHSLFASPVDAELAAVVERDPGDTTSNASVTWTCPAGPQPSTIRIYDEEAGDEIVNSSAASIPVPFLPGESTRVLHIFFVGMPRMTGTGLLECSLTASSRRQLRIAPHTFPTLVLPGTDYRTKLGLFQQEFGLLASGADGPLVAPFERQAAMISNVLAPLLAIADSSSLVLAEEDVERIVRLYGHVEEMSRRLNGNLQLARFGPLVGAFGALRSSAQALVLEAQAL